MRASRHRALAALACLLGCLLGAIGDAAAERRVALLVGSDAGLDADRPLRHTGADVQRMRAALVELGRFADADVYAVTEADAGQVLAALDALSARPADVFVFYYSGHADAGALRLGQTRLPLDLLLQRLERLPTRLRITVLDACQSGSAARPRSKGVAPGRPFEVGLTPDGAAGQVLIASSAADEASFESDEHHGAVFTLHWTTGLRGAADVDGDGQVRLSEAYRYAYDRTVGATLLADAGPQHPTFDLELAGRHDPPLTFVDGGSGLLLRADGDARYLVLDGREQQLLAELSLVEGDRRRVALPPGPYVVKRRSPDALHVARVELAPGRAQRLYDHQMRAVPLVRLAPKGALGDRWVALALGQYASPVGGSMQGTFGLEWEGDRWLLDADLLLSTGTQVHRGLESRLTLAGPTAAALFSWRPGEAALRIGPVAGALAMLQRAGSDPERVVAAGLLGGRLRFDLPLVAGLGLTLGADAAVLLARIEPTDTAFVAALPADLGVMPWLSYAVGLRVAW